MNVSIEDRSPEETSDAAIRTSLLDSFYEKLKNLFCEMNQFNNSTKMFNSVINSVLEFERESRRSSFATYEIFCHSFSGS